MLLIYVPKKFTIEPMQFARNDTEVTVTLPKEHRGYFTSRFRRDEIETITGHLERIWIVILNRSLLEIRILWFNQTQILKSNMKRHLRKTRTNTSTTKKNIEKEKLNLAVSWACLTLPTQAGTLLIIWGKWLQEKKLRGYYWVFLEEL